ncbi:MAG: HlyC/CorC family transporter [Deltaproteobacteria bacterium]|nr:MAG: HlyC/CorC family transporter [Deltaproteobacteria bacterium]
MIGWDVVALVGAVCLLCEGFFSGSELAMVSANRALLRDKAQRGDRGALLAERFLDRPQVLLSTTLIGTNLGAVAFSVVVTLAMLGRELSNSQLLTVATVSPFVLVFGEIVPKTLFQHYADALVTRIVYPLQVASVLFRPLVWVMSGFATFMTKLVGAEKSRTYITREEIAALIEAESEADGDVETAHGSDITEDEREMISNVLDMSDRTVADIMVPLSEVVALPEDATLAEAALEVADKQHTRIPIYRSRVDDIVGVLHAFDLLRAGPDAKHQPVSSIARPPVFVPEAKRAVDLLVELQGTGNQMAVVVDEYGGAVGIISVEDILEEIVGEIDDEYDTGPSPIRREGPNAWRVAARTPVDRLNEELGLDLPEDDEAYESIGGLILDRLKRIPRVGESLVVGDVTLTVTAATDRAIEEVRIRRNAAA